MVAEPTTYQGSKGTYTIDLRAGTYRGCLDSGGCISLERKFLIKNTNPEFTGIRWKNGEYVYEINEGALNVSQNGRIIFQDRVSTRSSEVGQVDRSQPLKIRKTNKINSCSSFSECNRAVDRDPLNSYAYLSRAKFYQSRTEATNALADYDKAIEVDPQNSDAYLRRASFKRSQNNDRAALADCHLAKKYAVISDSKNSSVQCINEIEYR